MNGLLQRADHALFGAGVAAEADLDEFRDLQRLAYQCAEEVAVGLRPGVTERQAVGRMRRWLTEAGVTDWFHTPFAWFGDRTAFTGFRFLHQFLPTDRALDEGMPYILDCAPVLGGACADIGYTGVIGANPLLDLVMDSLAEHRALILESVRAGCSLAEIYRQVDRLAERQGFTNRHRAYPGRVLAHRVEPLVPGPSRGSAVTFGVRQLRAVAGGVAGGFRERTSPLWNDGPHSDHPATPGLWAVEPHLGFNGVGAKFEELLVVTEGGADWLDDDLPHLRRWSAREAA